jgi:hypothetical protein
MPFVKIFVIHKRSMWVNSQILSQDRNHCGKRLSTPAATSVFGALISYPATDGSIADYKGFCDQPTHPVP